MNDHTLELEAERGAALIELNQAREALEDALKLLHKKAQACFAATHRLNVHVAGPALAVAHMAQLAHQERAQWSGGPASASNIYELVCRNAALEIAATEGRRIKP